MADLLTVFSVEGGFMLHSRRSCPVIRTELPYRDRANTPIRESRTTSGPAPGQRCTVCWDGAVGASRVEVVDPSSTVTVRIGAGQVESIRDLALRRDSEMAGRDLSYGLTSPERQFTGLLGEAAVLLWLSEELVGEYEFFGDRAGGADVHLRSKYDGRGWTFVEVKAHDAAFWFEHGRLLNDRQLARMDSDLVVWCVVPTRSAGFSLARDFGTGSCRAIEVEVVGWSPVEECRAGATPERFVKWSNMRVHAPLRTPADLSDWLSNGRPDGWGRGWA